MMIRFYSFLLALSLLVLISACSTGPTRPADFPRTQPEQLPGTNKTDVERIEYRPGFLLDPSGRSLAEVMELSRSMSVYQADIALEIIRSLESVSSSQLDSMIQSQSYDPEFTEWLELALQMRTIMINGNPVGTAAQQWGLYHYGHPVTRSEFSSLLSSYKGFYPVPSRVAVLLPTDGGLAVAAKAIRDGILSAYLNQPGDSELRFYSSGKNDESAIAAYLQAREDGATQIIGPLRLESTRALAGLANLSVPILLLNKTENEQETKIEQTGMVNSISLSQSEEAVSIAEMVLKQGQKNAIVIVPETAWGQRIGSAFTNAFEQGGGRIADSTEFNRSTTDYSATLTRLLEIDQSQQRKNSLQSQLGTPLTFEPNRRSDFDFIFLAASPQQGRELKPLLRFHDAGEVPVYSISRVYSGRQEQARDQDLNGIVFTSIPWQLKPHTDKTLMPASLRDGELGKLYALGQDAWHLLPWLPLMQKDADLWYPGEVGELRLQADGQLLRQPAWAQFDAGRPTLYQWPNL
jgi:outer membrane PBP1 activator LpoA protein